MTTKEKYALVSNEEFHSHTALSLNALIAAMTAVKLCLVQCHRLAGATHHGFRRKHVP
jgi:hypothetical protein